MVKDVVKDSVSKDSVRVVGEYTSEGVAWGFNPDNGRPVYALSLQVLLSADEWRLLERVSKVDVVLTPLP